jgi:hypothetical protein
MLTYAVLQQALQRLGDMHLHRRRRRRRHQAAQRTHEQPASNTRWNA